MTHVEIKVGGADLQDEHAENLLRISVSLGVSALPLVQIDFIDDDWNMNHGDFLEKEISVGFDLGDDTFKKVFTGHVVRAGRFHREDNTSTFRIEATNQALWSMQRSRRSRIFENQKHDDVIKTIASEHSLTPTGESGSATIEHLVQYQESDYNFLLRILSEAGWVYLVDPENSGKIRVKKENATDGSLTLEWGVDLYSYEWMAERGMNSPESKWGANDPAAGEQKTQAKDASWTNAGSIGGGGIMSTAKGVFYGRVPEVGHRVAEAGLAPLANAPLRDFYSRHGTASFKCVNTLVFPANELTIGDSTFAVQTVELVYDSDGFVCKGTSVLSGKPYQAADPPHEPRIYGPQTATVVDNIDAQGYDGLRVQVKFHWPETADLASAWIRVAQPWAGEERGTTFIPQVDDEVIVEFMDGRPDFPIITGSVYNGKNKATYPQESDRGPIAGVKTLRNEFKLDDTEGEERVELTGKKTIYVNANDEKATLTADDTGIVIEDSENPIKVTADADNIELAASQKEISLDAGTEIKLTAKTKISLTVGSNSIVIDSSSVTINGTQVAVKGTATAELSASGNTTVKGAMVMIN